MGGRKAFNAGCDSGPQKSTFKAACCKDFGTTLATNSLTLSRIRSSLGFALAPFPQLPLLLLKNRRTRPPGRGLSPYKSPHQLVLHQALTSCLLISLTDLLPSPISSLPPPPPPP
eukprot:c29642_g1_i1 orf=2-343(-)